MVLAPCHARRVMLYNTPYCALPRSQHHFGCLCIRYPCPPQNALCVLHHLLMALHPGVSYLSTFGHMSLFLGCTIFRSISGVVISLKNVAVHRECIYISNRFRHEMFATPRISMQRWRFPTLGSCSLRCLLEQPIQELGTVFVFTGHGFHIRRLIRITANHLFVNGT